jgi:ketosteroid isomerase-like protein
MSRFKLKFEGSDGLLASLPLRAVTDVPITPEFLKKPNDQAKEDSSMQSHANPLSAVTLSAAMFLGAVAIATQALAADMDVSKCPGAKTWQDAYNKGDAAGVAALYTADAIEVTPEGIRTGPAAVKERVEGSFKAGMKHTAITATKCNVEGATRWSAGDWKDDSTQGPVGGFWTAIETKDGNTWKIVNLTYNLTPPPTNK